MKKVIKTYERERIDVLDYLTDKYQDSFTNWQTGSELKSLASNKKFNDGQEVHVWMTSIDDHSDLYHLLSTEEKEKAANFKFVRDQQRYVTTHGVLRNILAAYISQDPAILSFDKTKYGKPFLCKKGDKDQLHFNITYSQNVICYIVSKQINVGIDIEYIKVDFDWASIAKAYFLSKELNYLASLPKKEQVKAFYYVWTRKEAWLKCKGIGLSGLDEMQTQGLKCIKNDQLISFNYGLNYQGALGLESKTADIHFYHLNG